MISSNSVTYLDSADRIGRQLSRDALWSGARCNWLGWSMIQSSQRWQYAYRAQPAPLYDGIAGIALFLAHLVEFTADRLERETLQGATAQLLSASEELSSKEVLGFYSGIAGIAHALFACSTVLGDERLQQRALSLLTRLADGTEEEPTLDVIGGYAGSIPMLLHAAARFDRDDLSALALRFGNRLLEAGIQSERGLAWVTMPETQPLLGYAHGAGGIACALLELYSVTAEERFLQAALEALRYERSYFNPEQRNWPDFRKIHPGAETAPGYPVAWCHGAASVGFSRIRVKELLPEEDCQEEIESAIGATLAELNRLTTPAHNSYSLCHGAMGNADFLYTAAIQTNRSDLLYPIAQVAQYGITQYGAADIPWPCGILGSGETPNLMLGLSGIGYFYLRLYSPATIPSILLLPSVGGKQSFASESSMNLEHVAAQQ